MLSLLLSAASASTSSSDLVLVRLEGEDIGGRRTAWVRVPPGPGPWRVMLAFHGGKRPNRGREMVERVRGGYADDLLVVYPNGAPWEPDAPAWAGPGHAEGALANRDVLFARRLVDEVDRRWDVDREQVYALGFSNGGFLTDALWCQASDVFHGFLVVGRAMPKPMMETCQPSPARPVMFVVGTADPTLLNDHQLTVPETVAYYREKLACEATDDPVDATATRLWTRCAPGAALGFREIEGLDHSWPKGEATAGGFDATPAFVAFLANLPPSPVTPIAAPMPVGPALTPPETLAEPPPTTPPAPPP